MAVVNDPSGSEWGRRERKEEEKDIKGGTRKSSKLFVKRVSQPFIEKLRTLSICLPIHGYSYALGYLLPIETILRIGTFLNFLFQAFSFLRHIQHRRLLLYLHNLNLQNILTYVDINTYKSSNYINDSINLAIS